MTKNQRLPGRLTRTGDVVRQGKRRRGHLVTSFHAATAECSSSLEDGLLSFAVVASKKSVDKRAVRRNRVKRRLRAAVRCLATEGQLVRQVAQSNQQRHLLWVLMANRGCLAADWESLKQEVKAHWESVGFGGETPCI